MTKLSKLLLLLIFGLAITNLIITNAFTGHGRLVSDLEQDIISLKHENLRLELQLAQATSLTNLTPRLKAAGFQTPKTVAGLNQAPTSVAMR